MDTLWSLLILALGFIACLESNQASEIPHNVTEEHGKVSCNPECGPETKCVKNNTCLPECRRGCGEKGVCIGPDRCGCELGYERDEEHNRCHVKCHPPCGSHEVCTEPGICICDMDYERRKDTKKCELKCCLRYDQCVAPRKLCCSLGYEWSKRNSKCLPECQPRCGLHSYCSSPNRCKCIGGSVPNDILNLSCSMPFNWWTYLILGVVVLMVVCCAVGIICCCVNRRSDISKYPNSNFAD